MSTYRKIRNWMAVHKAELGAQPVNIPLTRIEVLDFEKEEASPQFMDIAAQPPTIFGLPFETTEFAPYLRERRLRVPIGQYRTEYPIRDAMKDNLEIILRRGVCEVKAHILTDRTRLRVTFEWDLFAGLKRLLHITKWFPVRQRTREIDCSVLYPYAKVQFPHNRHTVHFSTP